MDTMVVPTPTHVRYNDGDWQPVDKREVPDFVFYTEWGIEVDGEIQSLRRMLA